MSKDLIIDYQKAGAVHLLAVSGLHVSVILALLFLVTKPLQRLKKGKLFSSIFVLIGLWFFAFIAGLSPSVVRAVTMFSIISIGLFLSKKTETLHSVFISMFLLLLISPYFAFSVGFQLSYLAVISILLIYPLINKIYTPKNKIIRFFWDIILVSISAQIGVLPLSLYYFHQFPSLFFVSSVVIIPFLGLILGLGILIMFLAVFKILPVWLADLYQLIIEKMNDFIHFIAEQESFLFTNISFSYFKVWISYLLILSIIFLLYKKKVKYVYLTLLVFIGFQLVNLNEKYLSQKTDELVVFDKFKHTLIANKIGNNVSFFISDSSLNNNLSIINYLLTHHKLQVKKQVFIPNIIPLKENNLLIIDSLGVYKHDLFKNGIILLRQTPKINLERLITNYQPKQIIADASNYKSAILQWKKTCYKYAVPFYDTNNQGAFKISY
jgi:competence protein ComEC